MHINLADHHHHGSSRVHRLDPRVKLLGTLLYILAASLLPAGAWLAYSLLLLAVLAVAWASELGAGFAIKRSFVALPFALAAITLPFTVPGQPLAQLGPLTISDAGLVRFASILVKSWLSVQMAILMTFTTDFDDLLWAMRSLGLPQALVSIVAFMYRYLFVLADEALRLMRARASRSGLGPGARKAGGSLAWRGRVAGGMVGNLTLRAFERSERIHDAMLARGYQGEMKTLSAPVMTDSDRSLMVGWVTLLAMIVMIGFVF